MKKTAKQPVFIIKLSSMVIAASIFGWSSVQAAETEGYDLPNVKGTEKKPTELSFSTESYHILPGIQFTAYYDDNIYASNQAEESDSVGIVSPSLKINSRWDKHSLKLNTGANIGRYKGNSDESYEDLWLTASGRYEVSPDTNFFAGAGYKKKHETRDSKESIQSIDEPTTYNVQSVQLGGRHRVSEYAFRVGLSYEKLDFGDVGDLINDIRDRTNTGLGLRMTKSLNKQTKVFAQSLYNDRAYDLEQAGLNRSSNGYTAALGFIRAFNKKDLIKAHVGMLSQDYEDPQFNSVNEPDFGIDLRWNPAGTIKFTGKLDRTLKETTVQDASGYLSTNLNLRLEKEMFTRISAYANYRYGLADYQQTEREDVYNAIGVGINYSINPKLLLTSSFTHYSNDSNDEPLSLDTVSNDYDRNIFLVALKVKMAP